MPPIGSKFWRRMRTRLQRLGVVLAPAGPRSVALHAFPLLLERLDAGDFVRDLMDLLSEVGAAAEYGIAGARRPGHDGLQGRGSRPATR